MIYCDTFDFNNLIIVELLIVYFYCILLNLKPSSTQFLNVLAAFTVHKKQESPSA